MDISIIILLLLLKLSIIIKLVMDSPDTASPFAQHSNVDFVSEHSTPSKRYISAS